LVYSDSQVPILWTIPTINSQTSQLNSAFKGKSFILLPGCQLYTKPVDNSVDCYVIPPLYDGFYYSFVKLYRNQSIQYYCL